VISSSTGGLVRLVQEHNLPLVAVAVCICAMGCLSVVNLMARAKESPRLQVPVWLAAAALAFGLSVWSTHFLAMLAFNAGMPIAYNLTETVTSIAIAGIGALLALTAWCLAPRRWAAISSGGLVLGLSIGGMHYTGVAAMRMAGSMILDPIDVAASIVMAVAFASLAFVRFDPRGPPSRRYEVMLWLTLSICGAHFTGMMGLRIIPCAQCPHASALMGTSSLAAMVASVSLAVMIVFVAATLMERHLTRLAAQEDRRLRLMNNLAREALIIHRRGKIVEVNQAAGSMFGQPPSAFAGGELANLFAPESAAALRLHVQQADQDVWPEELQALTADGRHVPVEITSQAIEFHNASATVVVMRDLSDRKRSEAQIRHMAHHDTLTNLPSRPLLSERLNTVIKTASVKGAGAAVLYLDLDRFKPVNDILGHAGGDAVLIEVARRLQAQTRSTDAVARLGGDEFVMVVGNVSTPDEIRNLAFRLIKTIEQPFDVEGRQIGIGVSIGAAIYPRDGNDPETLLRAADMAMYRAKSNGRGNVEFFDSRMDTRLRERRKLEQELRLAVERGEMMLHYQPLVDCRSGQINGFEALLRWNHPVHGIMNAGQFIPLAEETGVIGQLDSWAIEHACIEASGWAIPLNLAVNVSTSEFRQADWPRNVAAALTRSGLDPARLEIEVTESVLIQDPDRAVKTLSQLRDFGARLSLDDFGTGYSSLNYLRLFRFDKFKIDRSFANDLGRGTEAATIISAIINLGHTLGLSVTVEGIETADQLAQIVALGADQVQGYLLGRPGFVEDFKGAAMTQLWQFGEPSRTLVTSHG